MIIARKLRPKLKERRLKKQKKETKPILRYIALMKKDVHAMTTLSCDSGRFHPNIDTAAPSI